MKSIAQQIDGADSLQSRLITALCYEKFLTVPYIVRYTVQNTEQNLNEVHDAETKNKSRYQALV